MPVRTHQSQLYNYTSLPLHYVNSTNRSLCLPMKEANSLDLYRLTQYHMVRFRVHYELVQPQWPKPAWPEDSLVTASKMKIPGRVPRLRFYLTVPIQDLPIQVSRIHLVRFPQPPTCLFRAPPVLSKFTFSMLSFCIAVSRKTAHYRP